MNALHQCTKRQLTLMCREKKLRGYSRLNKSQLVQFMEWHEQNTAAAKIQFCFRRYRCRRQKKKGEEEEEGENRKEQVANHEDFATLEPFLPDQPLFRMREGNKVYRFCPKSLLTHMFTTGHFTNPYTRTSLSHSDLKRLIQVALTITDFVQFGAVFVEARNRVYVVMADTDLSFVKKSVQQEIKQENEHEETVAMLQDDCDEINQTVWSMISTASEQSFGVSMFEIVTQATLFIHGYWRDRLRHSMRQLSMMSSDVANRTLHDYIQDAIRLSAGPPSQSLLAGRYLEVLVEMRGDM